MGLEKLTISLGDIYENKVGREIGYVLSKEYWGKGLMLEAVRRVIKYFFEDEKYDFLQINHYITNTQSKKVIEKCGFQFVKENKRTALNGTEHISCYYVLHNWGGMNNVK